MIWLATVTFCIIGHNHQIPSKGLGNMTCATTPRQARAGVLNDETTHISASKGWHLTARTLPETFKINADGDQLGRGSKSLRHLGVQEFLISYLFGENFALTSF